MDQEILLTAIAAFFAIVSPAVIQWRKTRHWGQTVKVALPIIVSLVIAVAYLVATAALVGLNLLAAFLVVYGLQQLVYSTIIKHLQALRDDPAEEPKHLAE